jgi:hypothetical protein
MTADLQHNININYQQIENQDCEMNIVSSKIFISLSVFVLAFWLVFASLCILDFTGYTQNCIGVATVLQTLPNLVMILPVIFTDIDRRKLTFLYVSILLSVITNVIGFFCINSASWQTENIKTGCDPITELIKGLGGSIVAMLSYSVLTRPLRETIIFD